MQVPRPWPLLLFPMALVRSGWTMSGVLELRPDSLTVLLIHWGTTTVCMLKTLEWLVSLQVRIVGMQSYISPHIVQSDWLLCCNHYHNIRASLSRPLHDDRKLNSLLWLGPTFWTRRILGILQAPCMVVMLLAQKNLQSPWDQYNLLKAVGSILDPTREATY